MQKSYCDVTLACDGKFYNLHKFVLSTCSDYFAKLLELTQCKHPVIILSDVSHENLEALLNYMYVGEVNVLQENLGSLIKTAECLKVKGLAAPDEEPSSSKHQKRNREDGSPKAKRLKRSSGNEAPSESRSNHVNLDTKSNVRLSNENGKRVRHVEPQNSYNENNIVKQDQPKKRAEVINKEIEHVSIFFI